MTLLFPSLDALSLAITSGVISPEIVAAPVRGARNNLGGVLVQSPSEWNAATIQQLGALGVRESALSEPLQAFDNWLQFLPLNKQPHPLEVTDKTVVLLELHGSEQLTEVATEILRLGNDRQGFRQLNGHGENRTLLRVVGPPYYALLRAIESSAATRNDRFHCRAFYEQRSRVWVELGWRHPLGERLQPPPGKWLLLRAPHSWDMIEEAPFTDVYSVAEFKLPEVRSAWCEQPMETRFRVPLRLANTSSTDLPELWVLQHDAVGQVEQLVAHSDNELLSRLAFAVGEVAGRAVVVLRARPSKLGPPVLVLRALACRSYLKLPNLFVPSGQRLHPPLRRDIVAKSLAADPQQIVWLEPDASGRFTPRSLPDAAFQPLASWVDYVLETEQEALTAWRTSHRFEFESFVCVDDLSRSTPPQGERPEKPIREDVSATDAVTTSSSQPAETDEDIIIAEVVEPELQFATTGEKPQPSQFQQRLTALEKQFFELKSPLDSADRLPIWREMARLNGALDRRIEAALCWSQASWESSDFTNDLAAWLQDAGIANSRHPLPEAAEMQELISKAQSQRLPGVRFAVQLIAANGTGPQNGENLALAAQALLAQESQLPVRIVWLAWVALARLAHGDALMLARARDRLLERLFQQGLSPERDVPGFLRSGGGSDHARQTLLKEHMLTLRDMVAEWISEPPGQQARTRSYADLLFAYGLTSLGAGEEAQRIAGWARQQIGTRDGLHTWAVRAFEYRIDQAAQGIRHPSLSRELLTLLERMERNDRYKADQLRKHSRVLEPFERIDPYRRWHRRYTSDFERDLALLFDIADRGQLQSQLTNYLSAPPMEARNPEGTLRILATALELAPRLGSDFASALLAKVLPTWEATSDAVERAILLEKGLQIAAHFDQREAVQAFVERFESSLGEIVQAYLTVQVEFSAERQEKLVAIESLFDQSLRGLLKLGLREEISRIFGRMVQLIQEHERQPLVARPKGTTRRDDPTRTAKLLLAVAGGWFHFGQHELARPVIEEVRRKLFGQDIPVLAKTSLSCAYVSAIGQAPLEIAWPLLEELFAKHGAGGKPKLEGVRDSFATSSHFSLSQLDIVEATVLTLASDVFVLSREARQWLEEDEFLVRRRMHRDVREMMGNA